VRAWPTGETIAWPRVWACETRHELEIEANFKWDFLPITAIMAACEVFSVTMINTGSRSP
jgi:hypothetical protein